MYLLEWVPAGYRSLVLFLLHLGLLSIAYAWILCIITSAAGKAWTKMQLPGDMDAILRITVGHALLTAMTILATRTAIAMEPGTMILYVILGCTLLWITLAPELYDEYAGSANRTQLRSRILFVVRFLLVVLWIAGLVIVIHRNIAIALFPLPWLNDRLGEAFTLPYSIGYLLGALGVYWLFRSFFKAVFATLGLLGDLANLFRFR